MPDNFELLETGQIEIMHQQAHDRLVDTDNCDALRQQHDSLAAELVKRGLPHDTEVICPEIETDAPNYRRGFTDDICTNCAFGQLFPFCNLYKFDYTKGYTCDSFRYFEVLELEPPHGFLMAQEKQTAIAHSNMLDTEKAYLIVSNGEAFGVAEFGQPAQVKAKEFDSENWFAQHRVTARERRQWWADCDKFYVYRLKDWHPFEGIKLYEDGRVIDEPKLTAKQWKLVSTAKELPKKITLIDDAISIGSDYKFAVNGSFPIPSEVFKAAYQVEPEFTTASNELIPLYSLALVLKPRMRVSKKSPEEAEIKQEDETMPFRIRQRDDEYCVVKIEADDSDGETMGCHETEEEAQAQLTALNINVTAEEENAYTGDKPRKRKPRKKESEIGIGIDTIVSETNIEAPEIKKNNGFMAKLKTAAKTIVDIITLAETEEKEGEANILTSNYGIAQKEVNGELWHFTWSTNAFEDREGETFSTKSLENYVRLAEEKQDRGYFNLWHINAEDGHFNSDFARKEWQGVVGRFLVEAGPYLNGKKGQAAKRFFNKFSEGHPEIAPEGWGCSPEFRYLPEERATGVYENIWITRTSTLPKMAAANLWTETRQLARSKNMALSEDQVKAAVEIFQDEDFVKSLIAEGENKTAELEAAGVAHKEISDEPAKIELDMGELAAEVGKQFSANLEPVIEGMATMANEIKELKEWKAVQEKTQGIKDKTESPRFVFEMKRASESKQTVVTEDDGLKDKKPAETIAGDGDSWSQMFNK